MMDTAACGRCRNHGSVERLDLKHAQECPHRGCQCSACLNTSSGRLLRNRSTSSGPGATAIPSSKRGRSSARSAAPDAMKGETNKAKSAAPSQTRGRRRSKSIASSHVTGSRRSKSVAPNLLRGRNRAKSASPSPQRGRSQSRSLTPIPVKGRSTAKSASSSLHRGRSRAKSLAPSPNRGRSRAKSVATNPSRGRSRAKSTTPNRKRGRSQRRSLAPIPAKGRSTAKSASSSLQRGRSRAKSLAPSPNRGRSRAKSLAPSPNRGRSRAKSLAPSPNRGRSRAKSVATNPSRGRSRAKSTTPSPQRGRSHRRSLTPIPVKGRSTAKSASSSLQRGRSRAKSLAPSPNRGRSRAKSVATNPLTGRSRAIYAAPNSARRAKSVACAAPIRNGRTYQRAQGPSVSLARSPIRTRSVAKLKSVCPEMETCRDIKDSESSSRGRRKSSESSTSRASSFDRGRSRWKSHSCSSKREKSHVSKPRRGRSSRAEYAAHSPSSGSSRNMCHSSTSENSRSRSPVRPPSRGKSSKPRRRGKLSRGRYESYSPSRKRRSSRCLSISSGSSRSRSPCYLSCRENSHRRKSFRGSYSSAKSPTHYSSRGRKSNGYCSSASNSSRSSSPFYHYNRGNFHRQKSRDRSSQAKSEAHYQRKRSRAQSTSRSVAGDYARRRFRRRRSSRRATPSSVSSRSGSVSPYHWKHCSARHAKYARHCSHSKHADSVASNIHRAIVMKRLPEGCDSALVNGRSQCSTCCRSVVHSSCSHNGNAMNVVNVPPDGQGNCNLSCGNRKEHFSCGCGSFSNCDRNISTICLQETARTCNSHPHAEPPSRKADSLSDNYLCRCREQGKFESAVSHTHTDPVSPKITKGTREPSAPSFSSHVLSDVHHESLKAPCDILPNENAATCLLNSEQSSSVPIQILTSAVGTQYVSCLEEKPVVPRRVKSDVCKTLEKASVSNCTNEVGTASDEEDFNLRLDVSCNAKDDGIGGFEDISSYSEEEEESKSKEREHGSKEDNSKLQLRVGDLKTSVVDGDSSQIMDFSSSKCALGKSKIPTSNVGMDNCVEEPTEFPCFTEVPEDPLQADPRLILCETTGRFLLNSEVEGVSVARDPALESSRESCHESSFCQKGAKHHGNIIEENHDNEAVSLIEDEKGDVLYLVLNDPRILSVSVDDEGDNHENTDVGGRPEGTLAVKRLTSDKFTMTLTVDLSDNPSVSQSLTDVPACSTSDQGSDLPGVAFGNTGQVEHKYSFSRQSARTSAAVSTLTEGSSPHVVTSESRSSGARTSAAVSTLTEGSSPPVVTSESRSSGARTSESASMLTDDILPPAFVSVGRSCGARTSESSCVSTEDVLPPAFVSVGRSASAHPSESTAVSTKDILPPVFVSMDNISSARNPPSPEHSESISSLIQANNTAAATKETENITSLDLASLNSSTHKPVAMSKENISPSGATLVGYSALHHKPAPACKKKGNLPSLAGKDLRLSENEVFLGFPSNDDVNGIGSKTKRAACDSTTPDHISEDDAFVDEPNEDTNGRGRKEDNDDLYDAKLQASIAELEEEFATGDESVSHHQAQLRSSNLNNVCETGDAGACSPPCVPAGPRRVRHSRKAWWTDDWYSYDVVEKNSRFCGRCKNHNLKVRVKGHKGFCPFALCDCVLCGQDRSRIPNKTCQPEPEGDNVALDSAPPRPARLSSGHRKAWWTEEYYGYDIMEKNARFCVKCRNHDLKVRVKGHKGFCPFDLCECTLCSRMEERRSDGRRRSKSVVAAPSDDDLPQKRRRQTSHHLPAERCMAEVQDSHQVCNSATSHNSGSGWAELPSPVGPIDAWRSHPSKLPEDSDSTSCLTGYVETDGDCSVEVTVKEEFTCVWCGNSFENFVELHNHSVCHAETRSGEKPHSQDLTVSLSSHGSYFDSSIITSNSTTLQSQAPYRKGYMS